MSDLPYMVTDADVHKRAVKVRNEMSDLSYNKVYPVDRRSVPAAYALQAVSFCQVVTSPVDAHCFISAVATDFDAIEALCDEYPEKPYYALFDQSNVHAPDIGLAKIILPWDEIQTDKGGIAAKVKQMLTYLDPESDREGLEETPERVAKAWAHWTGGNGIDPADILKTFEDGADNYDQMISVVNIPFYSHCEHHLAAIIGTATVAYIPNGKIVGLSKLNRIVDAFARRLQVQERLTTQIADAIQEHLQPLGVGVVIKARHMCMESRGVCQQGHHTVTSALIGAIKDEPATRAEFLALGN